MLGRAVYELLEHPIAVQATARASSLTSGSCSLHRNLLTYLLSKLENEIRGAEGDLPAMAEFLRRTDVRVREALGLGGGSGSWEGRDSARPAKTKWVE